MAKQVKEEKVKKVSEKHARLNETRSNFYPSEHGSEEEAYKACSFAAKPGGKTVYWDKKSKCWYYYL